MGMRFVSANRRMVEIRNWLAPLTWKFDNGGYQGFLKHPIKSDTIIGYWAEDNTEYEITCPYQLRDCFLVGLNLLRFIWVPEKKQVNLEDFTGAA